MTEQQYRVHACNNTEPHEAHEFRGTYRKPSLPGVEITETFQCEGIEHPVPTTDDPDEFGSDELATAYLAWRDRGPGRDCERVPVAFEAGWDAHATSVSTSLPTRVQIAETLYRQQQRPTVRIVWSELPEWVQSVYFEMADALLALIQNGADR